MKISRSGFWASVTTYFFPYIFWYFAFTCQLSWIVVGHKSNRKCVFQKENRPTKVLQSSGGHIIYEQKILTTLSSATKWGSHYTRDPIVHK